MRKSCLVVLILLIGSGCSTERAELRVAAHPWPGYELLFLADSLGYLHHPDIRLIETVDATASKDLLSLGLVDAAALTLDEALSIQQQQGITLTIVLVFNISAGADMVLSTENFQHPAELEGKRLGYEPAAVAELMRMKLLQHAGLQADQLTEVHLPVNEHYDALLSGRVDAVITYAPTTQHLLREDVYNLFDSSQLPNLIFDVLAVRSDRLRGDRQQQLRELLDAHFRGLEHFHSNPQDAAFRIAGRFSLPAGEVLSLYRGLRLPGIAENHRLLGGDNPEIIDPALTISEMLLEPGDRPTRPQFGDTFSDDFLPRDTALP